VIKEIKEILYNDTNKLIDILQKLKCHKINPRSNKEIRCALPESIGGETNTSVQIKLNKFLSVNVYSRAEYEGYEIKDIVSFVQFLLQCSFREAIQWLCYNLGIEYNEDAIIVREQSETLKCLKQYSRKFKTNVDNDIMDEKMLNQYPKYIVSQWVKEGISPQIQQKYDIRIDKTRNRWLIPIRDENNNLVAIKGRTFLPNYKELNIPKYIYYKPNKDKPFYNNILFGLNYHYKYIKEKNETIIFEGEKSVMKAENMGIYNTISIGKNGINPYVLPKILKLHTNIVLALDKDVCIKDIIKECKKISKYTNVYYIYDNKGLLDKKDAPVDKGKDIWMELYNNKKRVL